MKTEPTKKGYKVWLSSKEMENFINCANSASTRKGMTERLTIAVTLAGRAGLRAFEIGNTRDEHKTDGNSILTVPEGKGGKYREVPLPKSIALLKFDDHLINPSTGHGVRVTTIENWIKMIGKEYVRMYGDEDALKITPLDLRRSWYTLLTEMGEIPTDIINKWGGWTIRANLTTHHLNVGSPDYGVLHAKYAQAAYAGAIAPAPNPRYTTPSEEDIYYMLLCLDEDLKVHLNERRAKDKRLNITDEETPLSQLLEQAAIEHFKTNWLSQWPTDRRLRLFIEEDLQYNYGQGTYSERMEKKLESERTKKKLESERVIIRGKELKNNIRRRAYGNIYQKKQRELRKKQKMKAKEKIYMDSFDYTPSDWLVDILQGLKNNGQ